MERSECYRVKDFKSAAHRHEGMKANVMSKYVDDLVSLKTEIMMGPRLEGSSWVLLTGDFTFSRC